MVRMHKYIDRVRRSIGGIWQERPRFANNPIIMRELITQLRRKQSFVYLFLFLAAASIVFVDGWETYKSTVISDFFVIRGRMTMLYLSLTQGVILLLFTPLLSGTAVNLEYERETWDLLATSPIGLASIIVGKLLSSFVFIGFLLLSITPVVSLTMPMGGVSPAELLVILLALGEGILIAALIGLCCSIQWKKTIHSISFTYVFCFIYFFVIPFAPSVFSGSSGTSLVFSPVYLIIYVVHPQVISGLSSLWTLSEGMVLHFLCQAFFATFLLGLSILLLTPHRKKRVKSWFHRTTIGMGKFAGKAWVLIAGVWAIALLVPVEFITGQQSISSRNILHPQQFLIALVLLLLFPLSSTVFFYLKWEEKPWEDVASTPSKLESMLYRCVWRPLSLYGKWMLGIIPLFLAPFTENPGLISEWLWFVLFGADAVLYIALISLACSLIARSVFQATAYCYATVVFYLFLLPVSAGRPFCLAPIAIAFSPSSNISSRQSSSRFFQTINSAMTDSAWIAELFVHFTITFVLFILILLFCQRRLLKMAKRFKRESFAAWFKRNLYNQKPKLSKVPGKARIPYFPNGENPAAIREIREAFLYQRNRTVQTSIWIFLGSAMFFWLFIAGNPTDNLHTPLTILLFLAPVFIVPYAVSSFRKERDRHTWDLLATTEQTPKDLLRSKLLASFFLFSVRYWTLLLPVVLIGLFAWTFGGKTYATTWNFFRIFLSIGYPFFCFVLFFSTYVSAAMKKTSTAYVVSILISYLLIYSPIFFDMMRYRTFRTLLSPVMLFNDYFNSFLSNQRDLIFILQITIYMGLTVLFYFLARHQLRKME